ncbi:MAG: hypothetical protein M3439_07485 [Chloroflexota bacterium]|nr:hypothetical protein [Chloroflexota bacterium]
MQTTRCMSSIVRQVGITAIVAGLAIPSVATAGASIGAGFAEYGPRDTIATRTSSITTSRTTAGTPAEAGQRFRPGFTHIDVLVSILTTP